MVWDSFQLVVLSGNQEDSLSRLILLLAVLDPHDSTTRQVRDVVLRAEVCMPVEDEEDVSRPRGVLIISLYRMLRVIQT